MTGQFASSQFANTQYSIDAIISSDAVPTRPDKEKEQYSYNPSIHIAKKRVELAQIENKISEAEKRKLAAQKRAKAKLLAEKSAKKLAALEASLQEEINVLRIQLVRLMRFIDDEEAILVLLLSQPLH